MFDEISIGNILKNARIEDGVIKHSQKEIGNEVSLADTTISAYEMGKIQPDFKTILRILKICGYELRMYNLTTGEQVSLEEYSKEL